MEVDYGDLEEKNLTLDTHNGKLYDLQDIVTLSVELISTLSDPPSLKLRTGRYVGRPLSA